MFTPGSRQKLDEMLGYERYVLSECGDAIRTEQGKSGPVRLIINDTPPHMTCISVSDGIGVGADMVRKMSPLVFTASFKILDMIFEWTIAENGISCPYQFDKKLQIILNDHTINYPDFLGTDPPLLKTTISLYRSMVPFRNAIVHNSWGQANQGTLDFDFNNKGRNYKRSISFDEVLALADSTELIGTMLVHQSSNPLKLDSIRYMYNKVSSIHGEAPFALSQARYFQVIRRTVMPHTGFLGVDMASVWEHVEQHSRGKSTTFDLMVVAEASPRPIVWKIPFSDLPTNTNLTLDNNWDRFLTDAAGDLTELAPFFK